MKRIFILVTALAIFGSVGVSALDNNDIDPNNFSTKIDNRYFTLKPGTTFTYRSETPDGTETVETIVTNLTREVMGVQTVVVWDRAFLNNELVEETYDWYAQAKNGDVWYFGEETREYDKGKVVSTHGAWEAGVDGADPGIIMKANPKVGNNYYQEYYKGEAEDQGKVLALNETVKTPYGTLNNCVKTLDYTKLEPSLKEHKYYCPKVGGIASTVNAKTGEKEELVNVENSKDTSSTSPLVAVAAAAGLAAGWFLGNQKILSKRKSK